MEVILKQKQGINKLSYKDIRPNAVYKCVWSPRGYRDGWVLIGVDYLDLFGIWAGRDSAIFSEKTMNYNYFEFVEINANLVEV